MGWDVMEGIWGLMGRKEFELHRCRGLEEVGE
jgi:hypothetical protein